jgi:hypothetical protein
MGARGLAGVRRPAGVPGPKVYPPLEQLKLQVRTPEERERANEFMKLFD